jgi:2'-5' RNA ligase
MWLKVGRLKLSHDPAGVNTSMKSIRSFIAVPLDPEITRAAVRLIERLREPGDGIKWVPTDNLHLTLKFLGDVHNTEVPQVCEVIREVCRDYQPFELKFRGAGGLPSTERARVLCAGVEDPSGSLTKIVMGLEGKLADLGFKPEARDYRPHLTLGRSKGRRANDDVIHRLEQEEQTEMGTMWVAEVQLVASFLDKHGPTYQVMDTIDL